MSLTRGYSFLSASDLVELKDKPLEIANKAQVVVDELSTHVETLKAEKELETTNHEQLLHQVEVQRGSLTVENEKLKKENDMLRKELDIIRTTNDTYTKELTSLRKGIADKEDRHTAITLNFERLQAEKRHALDQLERSEKEAEELKGEITKLNEQLKESFHVKADYQARISELDAGSSTKTFQITRLQQEREILEQFVKSANDQLNDKINELRDVRKSMSARITEAETANTTLTETVSRLTAEADSLRSKVSSLELKNSVASAELQALTEANAQLKEQHQFAINEKLKISDKIISERKHTHAKIGSLQEQNDKLQQDLKIADSNLDAVQSELDRTASELNRLKREWEKDKRATTASPISSHASPSAPTSPSMLSTPIPNLTMAHRLTIDEVLAKNDCNALKQELRRILMCSCLLRQRPLITQEMVTLYEDVYKLLINERNEHRRTSASFSILVKEVKEKAPVMAQQRKEHDRVIAEFGQLTVARQRVEELEVQAGLSNNEIARLQTQLVLYEEQLQTLLHETSDEPIGDLTQGQYRNTRELVQALSHWKQRVVELEAHQAANTSSDVESKLRLALEELEELKAARERQMDIMRDYMSKRDSYKVLSQSLQSDRSKLVGAEEPSTADIEKEEIHSTVGNSELYRELKKDFDEYKKEQAKSYSFIEQQLDQSRASESEAKISLAKSQSESKYLAERYKDTTESLQAATNTNELMRKKIDDYSSLLVQHQRTVDSLTNRCSELESLIRTLTAQFEATKGELAIRKASEDRFMTECSSITAEKGKLLAQIDNLRSMQAAAETMTFGERQKLESKLHTAQQESAKAKLVAETERKHLYSTINQLESRQTELQNQLTAAQKELAEVREGFGRAKATEESLATQLSEAKSALTHSEAKLTRLLDSSSNPKEATQSNRLELELSLAQADILFTTI